MFPYQKSSSAVVVERRVWTRCFLNSFFSSAIRSKKRASTGQLFLAQTIRSQTLLQGNRIRFASVCLSCVIILIANTSTLISHSFIPPQHLVVVVANKKFRRVFLFWRHLSIIKIWNILLAFSLFCAFPQFQHTTYSNLCVWVAWRSAVADDVSVERNSDCRLQKSAGRQMSSTGWLWILHFPSNIIVSEKIRVLASFCRRLLASNHHLFPSTTTTNNKRLLLFLISTLFHHNSLLESIQLH